MPYTGRGVSIGLGEESTWGTAVSRTNWLALQSGDLAVSVAKENLPHSGYAGDLGAFRRHFIKEVRAGGKVEFPCAFSDSTLLVLKHAMGGVATTGSGPYTHTFTLAALPTGLTIEFLRGDNDAGSARSEVFEGCKINTFNLSVAAGEVAKASAQIVAQTAAARGSAGTPTYNTSAEPILHSYAGTITWNGVAYSMLSMDLSIENTLLSRQFLGSNLIQNPVRGDHRKIMIKFVIEYENDNYYNGKIADTVGDFTLSITGTGNNAITITGHNAYVADAPDAPSGPGITQQSITLICQADATDRGLQIAITNDNATAVTN